MTITYVPPTYKNYARQQFVELAALCEQRGLDIADVRTEIEAGHRPRPFYVFADGTEFVARDYFELETDSMRFATRLRARADSLGMSVSEDELAAIWEAYLAGQYDACLHNVTPETIIEKSFLVDGIESLLQRDRKKDERWRAELKHYVDRLDALIRPFSDFDRGFFGGPVSRDVYVTDLRARFGL